MWDKVKKNDTRGIALADEHYSRVAYGKQGAQLGPPGALLCLLSDDANAIWVSHWPYAEFALDGLDAFRCTMFRTQSQIYRASDLIKSAMERTQEYWKDWTDPVDEWITWVVPNLVESRNPGYCFKAAGWWLDREWKGQNSMIRLRAHL